MDMTIRDLADFLEQQGIEKLAISGPTCTLRMEGFQPSESGAWRVSLKRNGFQVAWTVGKWKPTLHAALVSALGPIPTTSNDEMPQMEVEIALTSITGLLV